MGLFREKAIESSSSSDMGKSVTGIRISVWLSVLGIAICAAIFMIWVFFGTVYETVSVTGVVWPLESNGTISSERTGIVTKTVVSSGTQVNTGDILAILSNDELLEQIEKEKAANNPTYTALQEKYIEETVIRSPVDGIVSHLVNEGTHLDEGEVIAKVVPYDEDGNNQRLTAFIPADMIGQVNNSMKVQIVPEFASRDKDGYVYGYISDIGKYPLTGEYIRQNYDPIFSLGAQIEQKYVRVEITMVSDANAKSGLKWSNSASDEINIELGTLCSCDVVTKEVHPYQYLIR